MSQVAPPLLQISNLTVDLPSGSDRPAAIQGLTLSLERNETLCVVGESGSGKSITAMALMGLLPRNFPRPSGRVLFQGYDLLTLSPSALRQVVGRRIAMIFQEPTAALNPVYRIGDQVAEVFQLHTDYAADEIHRRVVALFEEVRLPEPERIYRSYPHQLSGGQCQRAMIATALALEPAVLIADEATTALDVTTQAQILSLMRSLKQRHGTGIIFITHDFGVVAEMADRVAVMQNGQLIEQGTRDEVLLDPKADYTRKLLAAVPRLTPRAARPNDQPDVLVGRGLNKTYGRSGLGQAGRTVKALQDVDVTLRRGETVAVVGESGSGKSTLAQCVIRLLDADSGSVTVAGRDFVALSGRQLRQARSKVQIIFQDPYTALDPRQSVGSAIAEGPIVHGMASALARERARDLLVAVGLQAEAANRYPHEFSGGQRQRICIARALALEPDLLIADEAVSALDVSVQAQILDLLGTMQQRLGFGMLFITHDLRVASSLADRIMVMRGGQVVEEGEPAALLAAPRNDYTRALLAAVPGLDWQKQAAP